MATKIMPVSDLRRQTSSVIKAVREQNDVVYITQHGRPAVVMVDYEEYEAMIERLADAADMASLIASTDESVRDFDEFLVEMEAMDTQPEPQPQNKNGVKTNLFSTLAGMAEDLGVDDLAAEYDHYLYGVEKTSVR